MITDGRRRTGVRSRDGLANCRAYSGIGQGVIAAVPFGPGIVPFNRRRTPLLAIPAGGRRVAPDRPVRRVFTRANDVVRVVRDHDELVRPNAIFPFQQSGLVGKTFPELKKKTYAPDFGPTSCPTGDGETSENNVLFVFRLVRFVVGVQLDLYSDRLTAK